jgi:hypothetical protein
MAVSLSVSQSVSQNTASNDKMTNEQLIGKGVEWSVHSRIEILHRLCFEALRKTTKTWVRIVGVTAEMPTENLTNRSQKRYRFTQFVR